MTKQEAINHFGGVQELADALRITYQAVAQWQEIPLLRQCQLEVMTKRKLKAEKQAA